MDNKELPLTEEHLFDAYVDETIEDLFVVEDSFFDRGKPTYIVSPKGEGSPRLRIKDSFKELAEKIRSTGYYPHLRWIVGKYYISCLSRERGGERNYRRNILLFAATLVTVFIDGYLRSNNPVLTEALMSGTPVWANAIIFTVGIITIFGLHELGHKAISMIEGIDSSMPYFIPAPPGMGGTFGAVITQKDPPINRDALFDLGLSGPLTGFIATIVVAIVGLSLSFTVPETSLTKWMMQFPEVRFTALPFPMLLNILSDWIKPTPVGYVLIMHPLGFAAWVGCLITFINLIPAWQLDGGHISRSLLGKETHKIISVAGILILAISGYFVMAAMVFFFMIRGGGSEMELLDDVSPLSKYRVIAIIIYILLMALTLITITPF